MIEYLTNRKDKKGEDFGLMRKMFDAWYGRYRDLLKAVDEINEIR